MKLVLYSINHHQCPVRVREKVSFSEEQQHAMLREMHTEPDISDAVILQTCNRLEFYLYARKSFDTSGFLSALVRKAGADAAEIWDKHRVEMSGNDVVRHLFEVSAGLDSQMIGENQVLSQVKAAYAVSLECRMSKIMFHRLFHNAFRVGKTVRTETNINCGAVSLGLAAVELARGKLDLSRASAMVIGAGENAELVIRYLIKSGLKNIVIANRDVCRAQALCSALGCAGAIGLDEIASYLDRIDLLIASTSAAEPIVTLEMAEKYLSSRSRKLLAVDLAVPRDIDAGIGKFKCVSLYNIDDLNEHIVLNKEKREKEIPKARRIVEDFTAEFGRWNDSLSVVPVIAELTKKGVELARSEARRYAKDFSGDSGAKLEVFAESLAKKLLHGPISFIKAGSEDEPSSAEQMLAVELINRMFFPQDKADSK